MDLRKIVCKYININLFFVKKKLNYLNMYNNASMNNATN